MSLKRHSPSLSGKRNHCTPWFQTGVCITHNMTPRTTGRQQRSHFPPAKPPCTRGPPSFSTSHYSHGKWLSQCSPQSLCFTAACTAAEGHQRELPVYPQHPPDFACGCWSSSTTTTLRRLLPPVRLRPKVPSDFSIIPAKVTRRQNN